MSPEHESRAGTLARLRLIDQPQFSDIYAECGYGDLPGRRHRDMYSYSCAHPLNPEFNSEHDGNCIISYCPFCYAADDDDDDGCEGDRLVEVLDA